MTIPLLDLKAHHQPIEGEILEAIQRVVRSQVFILGPEVEQLEKSLAAYCQARFAIGVSSGTDALLIALMALDVKPGDEILTTPFSFFATAGAIARLGARPVFVDIDPQSLNMAPELIEKAITSKTKGILPVHLFGQCAEMSPILEFAKSKHLWVIEDAAQAIGSEYKDGRRAGTMGDMGCFSFFPSKNLGALGDAGLVTTNSPELAEKLKILRVHGSQPKYYHRILGGNFRIDALQAAALNVKLKYLDAWTQKRQENAERYRALFKESGLLTRGEVELPHAVYEKTGIKHHHIYNQFSLRARKRDLLKSFLDQRKIGTEVYYPVPLHMQECFKSLGYREGNFPHAERTAREALALPIYPELTPTQQETVVQAIKEFYSSSPSS